MIEERGKRSVWGKETTIIPLKKKNRGEDESTLKNNKRGSSLSYSMTDREWMSASIVNLK